MPSASAADPIAADSTALTDSRAVKSLALPNRFARSATGEGPGDNASRRRSLP